MRLNSRMLSQAEATSAPRPSRTRSRPEVLREEALEEVRGQHLDAIVGVLKHNRPAASRPIERQETAPGVLKLRALHQAPNHHDRARDEIIRLRMPHRAKDGARGAKR